MDLGNNACQCPEALAYLKRSAQKGGLAKSVGPYSLPSDADAFRSEAQGQSGYSNELKQPQWQMNQCLYQWVGSSWHWRDKLPWQEDQWKAYALDPTLRTFVSYHQGHVAGYYELKHHDSQRGVEIAIFGLILPIRAVDSEGPY